MATLKREEANDWIVFEYGASRVYIAPVPGNAPKNQRPDETMAFIIEQAIRKITDKE